MRLTLPILLCGLFALTACKEKAGQGDDGGAEVDAAEDATLADAAEDAAPEPDADPGPQCLGTIYPNDDVIDPDNPVFSDATHTQAEVEQMFADAKAANNQVYRAYRAARDYADLLECAFCACGCVNIDNHISAVDCFKDLHGFP